jgi:maltose alpha-D-glucosyltransferase/alpha-amylase
MTEDDPLWYKDAIIYEVHVRAFQDSVADGIGDFKGLRQRLDYLQDLGVTAIWLLPFYPSPLKDDGYDIADYTNVHPNYGTLKDFREFLDAAHRRGLKVITELVINHTSDQHPWFQRARRAPIGSPERNFYVWSDTPDKYSDARIIFKDFERSNWTYDPVAGQYFWHRFYSHQPDLNFDNPAVWDALIPVLEFWLDMGVDGMRLDAIPYLYEREGTNCENLPETHAFLKHLRRHLDSKYHNRMFLAEANQWPEDAIAYFGDGDECHMAFHFPLMPRLYMALHQEDRFPIIDILEQTPPIPETCQWCLFLRNHDELTLEMVTDEERDYMYRAYASDPQARINLGIRRRLAPLLRNDRRRIELMNVLLFSLPGTPVIYYGDEIGMGDNFYLGDRNGVRTPMQWSSDRNAGFSRANPQKLYLPVIIDPEYHYEAVNVDAQQGNSSSLLWWMKRLIALRKQYKAFGRGSIEFLRPENPKILAFIRRYRDEIILIVANLSRFVQYVQLDLSEFKGLVPYELVGRNPFPPIGELPYLLTLGPHGSYAFAIRPSTFRHTVVTEKSRGAPLPRIAVRETWEEILEPARLDRLKPALISHLAETATTVGHWKSRTLRNIQVRNVARMLTCSPPTALFFLDVEYLSGEVLLQLLPIAYIPIESSGNISSGALIAEIAVAGQVIGTLIDARGDARFCTGVLQAIANHQVYSFDFGDIICSHFPQFDLARGDADVPLPITISQTEQGNISLIYGGRLVLKSYEKLEPGVNPDLELGRFLTDHTDFKTTAPVLGAIELHPADHGQPITLSVLFGYVPNEGTGWNYTLDTLSRYYEAVLAHPDVSPPPFPPGQCWQPGFDGRPTGSAADLIEAFLHTAEQLGTNTAQLHLALASDSSNPALAPEPITKLYQRSLYQSMRTTAGLVFRELRRQRPELPAATQDLVQRCLALEGELSHRFRRVLSPDLTGQRIRIHGNYQLNKLLYTGNNFVLIDFEGGPTRSLSERKIKRSPLRDVATMIRSFHDAAFSPLFGAESAPGILPGHVRDEDREGLRHWARFWYSWVVCRFVQAYYAGMANSPLLPSHPRICQELLELFVLDQAVTEAGYDLMHRPAWVPVPLTGLLEMLES